MLFFVANTNVANIDFFGAREVLGAKGDRGLGMVAGVAYIEAVKLFYSFVETEFGLSK